MKFSLKTLLLALTLFLLLPAGVSAMSGIESDSEIFHPTITGVKGTVSVKGSKYPAWEEAREGMLLLSGDTLRTGQGAYAKIEFPSGELEIYETTVVVIPTIGNQDRKKDIREVIINEGVTLFDINPQGVREGFKFRTRNIQGGVKGTLFTVSYLDGGTAVNVYRGEVEVSDTVGSGDTNVKLTSGKSVRVEKKADFAKIKTFDPSNALKDYQKNVPPGLTGKGLPADHNANPKNKGRRKRGGGKPDSADDGSHSSTSVSSDNDHGEDE